MADTPENITEVVKLLLGYINPLLTILLALAILVFFKGIINFIAKPGDDKSRANGKKLMVWGLVALFVMTSFLGIIRLFYNDLGFNFFGFGIPQLPD